MEGRALPPRPSSASSAASQDSSRKVRFQTQFNGEWIDKHGTLGLAQKMELDQAMSTAVEKAALANACEPEQVPTSSSSTSNFTRVLYELDYASRDLQGLFEASNLTDQNGNLRHQLKFSHWGRYYERYQQAFKFLTSIENAGWVESSTQSSDTIIPVAQIATKYDEWGAEPVAPARRASPALFQAATPRSSKQLKMIKNLRPVEAMLNDPKLKSQEWFHGLMNRKETEELLKSMLPGAYLFRISTSHKGLTLSIVTTKGHKHYLIHYQQGAGYFIFGKSKAFKHINDLVRYYNANPITGINTMLVFPAPKATADDDMFGGQETNYVALLEEKLDPEVFAMVEDLARERKEAEQHAAVLDPMGADADTDPVLLQEQSQRDSQPHSQPRRSWFRGSVSVGSKLGRSDKSHPDIGPPVPIRGSVKGNGMLGRAGRGSDSSRSDEEGSFGFAPVLTKEELQSRIAQLDSEIDKETRMAQAAARLHDQPGSGPVQDQRRSEAEISMARLASLQASRREYQQQLTAP
eukprot:m.150232 g.150232  ORF g.150232 m.150232 type:complete len:522 (+) comp16312_c0_seq3:43-1608(+)